ATHPCANTQCTINPDSHIVEANGTPSNTFGISSTCSWSLGAPPAWLSVSPSSGSGNTIVTATCTPNNSTQPRSHTLLFTGCGSITRQVFASQKGCTLPGVPSISPSGPTSLCPGNNVTLTAANVCSGCTVSWSNGMTGPAITVNTPGNYSATVANACGASNPSNAVTVTSLSAPTTPSVSANGDTELCPGESRTLNAMNVCAGCTVQWSNNQTGTSIVVNTPGVYTATASNNCGTGSPSNGITLTLAAPPAAPVISALGVPELCQGQTVTLIAAGVCTNCSLAWSGGQTGPSITVASPGIYAATVTDACGLTAVAVPFEVKQAPPYVPVVQVNNTCYLAAPQGSEYQWGLNGLDIPGANTQFLTAQTTGYYTVKMKNLSDCPGKSDPLFVQACSSSAGEQEESVGLRLFPNPTTGRLTLLVKTERPIDGNFDVFSSDGRFAGNFFRDRLASGEHALQMELPGFAPGVYYYMFRTDTEIFRGAFIVVE
ncbi:MAG: BACON domain-containing protein, partial [Saprospiraceae bacterium]